MIAIQNSKGGFHSRWINYCRENNIPYKLVNCYANDIIAQLDGCNALMWHHSQNDPKALLVAKQILFALEHSGFQVFPDFYTNWHFDDKVGQKYLLEAIGAPMVQSYIFFDTKSALDWVDSTFFPKIFKLRRGAGSSNVVLVKNVKTAKKIIRKAFKSGFSNYDGLSQFKEIIRKYKLEAVKFITVLKSAARIFASPRFATIIGRERDYVYFQDFLPDNLFDIRIIVIGNKAFALKRMVRKNDFRASGSGIFKYAKEEFDERCLKISFDVNKKLKSQCIAFDYIFDLNNEPLITEISYGFLPEGYDDCHGYWDESLKWYPGKFNPYGWMVEGILNNKYL